MIDELATFIPGKLSKESGSVFYSGRRAFSTKTDMYILGLNPGGDPIKQVAETIEKHTNRVLNEESDLWSAYRDDSWSGKEPGKWGMQPRVLHLLSEVGMSPDKVPASNIVFLRSKREHTIKGNMYDLAKTCWTFHQKVIEHLQPRVILCFGKTSSNFVCEMLNAKKQIDEFVEDNHRKWGSQAYINNNGIIVISATHPSIANWNAQATDPSRLVKKALAQ